MNEIKHTNSARLDDLEMRIAHQDNVITELNDVITAQWRSIAVLERQVAQLREAMDGSEGLPRGAPEPPPPHY
jgi:SlyX protein